MLSRFQKHIEQTLPIRQDEKILIAISGGLDSVVLANVLYNLDFTIAFAHVNFQLRGLASDKDCLFVKKLGVKMRIPVFTKTIDTTKYAEESKLSIQVAAREIRYNWFAELLEKENYNYVVTAHHADDNEETFFINLNRATGIDGLIGIPEVNGKIVRPLLPFSRLEIKGYALANKLTWREDESNAATKYKRNEIRHKLIPIIHNVLPEFSASLIQTQSYLKQTQDLAKAYLESIKPQIISQRNDLIYLSLAKLQSIGNTKAVLHELLKEFGFTQWNDICDLQYAQTGKQILSHTHRILKDREYLVVGVIVNKAEKLNLVYKELSYNKQKLDFSSLNTVYIDKNKVSLPFSVRKWEKGDYFYPFGMKGKKKLSDFFTDLKLSSFEKEKIQLLCNANNQIIWVIGKRLDERFKIDKTTTVIIKITHI